MKYFFSFEDIPKSKLFSDLAVFREHFSKTLAQTLLHARTSAVAVVGVCRRVVFAESV